MREGASLDMDLHAGVSVGRFQLLSLLGEGGMAVVWAAYDPQLDRRVALKFLRAEEGGAPADETRLRMLREAQAMARLSHPNVLAVHEVGTEGDWVYIAQELVVGQDLSRWLAQGSRARGELLRVFAQAGEGLAAAHRAGLVHRDFKPANVLLGDDGRVRVADFGLARTAGRPGPPPSANPPRARPVPQSLVDTAPPRRPTEDTLDEPLVNDAPITQPDTAAADVLSAQLTTEGAVLGTPHFMAPEQFQGRPADERSDQFAFCVSLYRALYGQVPFAGSTYAELKQHVLSGDLAPPPAGNDVPAWLRAALLRGLETLQEDRYPSMGALLAALHADPSVARRHLGARVAWALGAVVVVGALGWAVHQRSLLCEGTEAQLAGTWDAPRRATTQAAFLATGAPWASRAFDATSQALDAWAAAWVTMHRDACEATRRRGEQSEEVLDLRMQCLADRLAELKASTDVLAAADPQVVEHAASVVAGLTPVSGCADVTALKAPERLPADPSARTRVEAVHTAVARVRALYDAGKYQQAAQLAQATLSEAQATHHRPVEAEALLCLGQATVLAGDTQAGTTSLEEAFYASLAAGREDLALRAAAALVLHVGVTLSRHEDGHRWERVAKALLERSRDPLDTVDVARASAALLWNEGKFVEAAPEYERALGAAEKALGPDHVEVLQLLTDAAFNLYDAGRADEALEYYRRALATGERTLDPEHPMLAAVLNGLAVVLVLKGQTQEALEAYQRALAISQKALGPNHRNVGVFQLNLADLLITLGRTDEAEAQIRGARDVFSKALGPRHPDTAATYSYLADVLVEQGRAREAIDEARVAVSIDEEVLGATHPRLASALESLGTALNEAGRPAEAVTVFERALGIREAQQGADHPETAQMLMHLAGAWFAQGDVGRALPLLERAAPIIEEKVHEPDALATLHLLLAQVLWAQGRDLARATKLAHLAHDDLAALPTRAKDLAKVNAWLATHGR